MRVAALSAALLLALTARGARIPGSQPEERVPEAPAAAAPAPVRFEADVAPILSRCRPCHYPGGVMHGRLPFDDEAAVRKAGEKLFTRVKDEKERAVLRRFFAAAH